VHQGALLLKEIADRNIGEPLVPKYVNFRTLIDTLSCVITGTQPARNDLEHLPNYILEAQR
jgi:hypothetical protein